ncbi:MAG: hypothetical protein Q7J68_04615 [Thermoplasmata archaeon]|nr:hypothetical protein [Thermoplasmata archaeon]
MRKLHWIQILPLVLLAILTAWHFYSYYTLPALGSDALHYGVLVMVFIMTLASLFFRSAKNEVAQYVESLVKPFRAHLVGAACLLVGSLHFIGLLGSESIFIQMGFLILILAFFETAGIANRFIEAYSGNQVQVTESTLKRLILNQMGMVAMVFVLSVVLLYMALMVIVGFTDTWSVALLAAVMILAIAFMTMARRL